MKTKKAAFPAVLLLLAFALILASGCVAQPQGAPDLSDMDTAASDARRAAAIDSCTRACGDALSSGADLSAGPCLLNPVPGAPEWVCDVAHSPRTAADNIAENQCNEYRIGTATHFVEVAPDCGFIKAV